MTTTPSSDADGTDGTTGSPFSFDADGTHHHQRRYQPSLAMWSMPASLRSGRLATRARLGTSQWRIRGLPKLSFRWICADEQYSRPPASSSDIRISRLREDVGHLSSPRPKDGDMGSRS
ncbi:hypothetical protein TIFTF001_017649 [Ficus carica]|uniref:Uncharacterized protein n=1 Tax=Ficus carica TaxID=3494 RepID=A0AA88DJ27_FICCA|nr:hypothetical protein TIFTF001_017649 [Ficus carica]